MQCTFRPGDKVVCVNAGHIDPGDESLYEPWDDGEKLVEGEIYTVTSVHVHDGDVVLHLAEVERTQFSRGYWGNGAGYCYTRFRPARNIEQFRKIVADVFCSQKLNV